ncbi:uncharacterized protein B0T15DRAFT_510707 [Chaetomium strumarium]|uniref:Cyanovirin-N domain-containing protein n=1 Tax=Chaetomium strumarium TaxID=1170767 RepID=A0AAJ0GWJ3_9PEZI|nr:hypothetical protein B0T15DRAFT_510707 [Chaetomium strumarium]
MRSSVLFSLAASLITVTAECYGNFSLSCTGVSLFHGFFLGATCATCCNSDADSVVDESETQNELDLTMCIGLNQTSGHMKWEVYGKFSNYCNNCTMLQAVGKPSHLLTCFCEPLVGSHGPVQSTLNLDDGISNDRGTLKCAGGMANLAPGKTNSGKSD